MNSNVINQFAVCKSVTDQLQKSKQIDTRKRANDSEELAPLPKRGKKIQDVNVADVEVYDDREFLPEVSPIKNQLALPDFSTNEIIWARIRGHPYWPAKVMRIYGVRLQMLEILWLNDYRRSKINKGQAKKFLKHFEEYAAAFSKHVGLETAAKEGMIYIASMKSNGSMKNLF